VEREQKMSIVNWVINSLAGEDIIDLYFVLSDLKDIDITEAEATEAAYFDSMANHTAGSQGDDDSGIPMGKRVY
jgi:hypothetical protein